MRNFSIVLWVLAVMITAIATVVGTVSLAYAAVTVDPIEGGYTTMQDLVFDVGHLYMFSPDTINYFGEITDPGSYEFSLYGGGLPNIPGEHIYLNIEGDPEEIRLYCGQTHTLEECITEYPAYVSATYLNDPVLGCTDPLAENYNPEANDDDGSCIYPQDPIAATSTEDQVQQNFFNAIALMMAAMFFTVYMFKKN